MNEEQDQVVDDVETSDEGAMNASSTTQDSQVSSSDDGTTDTQEPTVADLQKQIQELQKVRDEERQKWAREYQNAQSERDKALNRLAPYEQQARMAQEEVERQNEAFHDRAAKIGYPAAIAELNAQQRAAVEAQLTREQIVSDARQKFIDAGKMPSEFEAFYNSRSWATKEAFMDDVNLHLDKDHVTKVTSQSKEALARAAEDKARRDAANKQPKGGGDPSVSHKSSDPGQKILDGMAEAARRINAAQSEL